MDSARQQPRMRPSPPAADFANFMPCGSRLAETSRSTTAQWSIAPRELDLSRSHQGTVMTFLLQDGTVADQAGRHIGRRHTHRAMISRSDFTSTSRTPPGNLMRLLRVHLHGAMSRTAVGHPPGACVPGAAPSFRKGGGRLVKPPRPHVRARAVPERCPASGRVFLVQDQHPRDRRANCNPRVRGAAASWHYPWGGGAWAWLPKQG